MYAGSRLSMSRVLDIFTKVWDLCASGLNSFFFDPTMFTSNDSRRVKTGCRRTSPHNLEQEGLGDICSIETHSLAEGPTPSSPQEG
jgi:hypothetical protein